MLLQSLHTTQPASESEHNNSQNYSGRFSSMSELEEDSEDLEDLNCTRQLIVPKIIISDIFFSLADNVTDMIQGLDLLCGNLHLSELASSFHLISYEKYWREKGQYGLTVLLLIWSPGLVAVVHMLAFYREDYAVKRDNEAKTSHIRRRGYFFLKLFLIFLFYPIVPAFIYARILWVWGNKNISSESLEKRQNLARQIRGISGGFEAGLQLTLTLWLVLKEVIPLDEITYVHWRKGSYGNYSPSIPLISAVSSLIAMSITCVRLNLPLPYRAYGENEFGRRYEKQFSQILNSLSHYVFSCLFRVSCLAFMWIYLAFYAAIPILLLLFINILIFYTRESDKGLKQEIKNINKEIKLVYRNRGDQSLYKYKRLQSGVWLSSFIGLFMPCCYTKPLETSFISYLTMNVDILSRLDEIRERHNCEITKYQEIAAVTVNVSTVIIIYLLVNFTGLGYMQNVLENRIFRICCLVLLVQGIVLFILTVLDVERIISKVRSKPYRLLAGVLVVVVSFFVLICPLVGGVLLHSAHNSQQVVMLVARDSAWQDNRRQLTIVFVSRLTRADTGEFPRHWRETVTCYQELLQLKKTPRVLLADLHDETCLKLLSDESLIRQKSKLTLVLQTEDNKWRRSSPYLSRHRTARLNHLNTLNFPVFRLHYKDRLDLSQKYQAMQTGN